MKKKNWNLVLISGIVGLLYIGSLRTANAGFWKGIGSLKDRISQTFEYISGILK